MMLLSIKLILAHLIGDFLIHPQKWVKHKNKNKHKSKYLYWHIFIHALALIILLQFNYWLAFVIIIPSHFLIDLAKLYLLNKKNKRWLFVLDQLAHLLMIAIVIQIYEPFLSEVVSMDFTSVLLLFCCLIGVTTMSAIIMRIIISKWNIENYKNEKESLENAGTIIGILERLFVFLFVITDFWSGIGFLLAAKSIFRFGDLSRAKDRKLTEYVLIGTLISFGLAIGIGMIYLRLKSEI